MSLFSVEQIGTSDLLVVAAEKAVAENGQWTFFDETGRMLVTLPTNGVQGIKARPEDNSVVLARRPN